MHILVVEDDEAVATALSDALSRAGHAVTRCARGAEALLRHREAELVLLDLGLPDIDGMDVLAKLRQVSEHPIIILTARGDQRSVVTGLRRGADDYLVKPVRLAELLARIEAVSRRAPRAEAEQAEIAVGELRVNTSLRTASLAGSALALTSTEWDLLVLLVRGGGSVVTREQLLDAVWGDAFLANSRALDVHLSGLRAKLDRPGAVVNVRGVGYRIDCEQL